MDILPSFPPVQRSILTRLATESSLRYAELQSEDVEGNLHTYHLNQLIKEGYIVKKDKAYALSVSGRRLIGIFSTKTGHPRLQPKLTTMLCITNSKGEYLLYRWKRHPFLGLVSFPYGKMHLGESVFAAANRELQEKTSAKTALAYRGTVFIKTEEDGMLLNHMESHVFCGVWSNEAQDSSGLGECFWGQLEDIPEREWCPGFPEVCDLLAGQLPFFEEIVVQL
jgi:ADP-ribose pyrophosphatase YjhB (NUDIX family)